MEPTTTTQGVDPTPFDEGKAQWLMKKLQAVEAQRAALKASYEKADRSLLAEKNSLMHRHGQAFDFWVREKIASLGGRKRSVNTLYGTYGLKKTGGTVKVADAASALKHLITNELFGAVSVDRTKYAALAKKELEATGELLPGVEIEEVSDKLVLDFPVDFSKTDEIDGSEEMPNG